MEELTNVQLNLNDLARTMMMETMLPFKLKDALVEFLKVNSNLFTSSHDDMPSINLKVMMHRLSVNVSFRTIKQQSRSLNPKRYEAIKVEVDKLLKIGLMKEVFYRSWLANVVLVKETMGNGEYVLILPILTKFTPKIASH